jgi:RimJ/RimL family protein N-acetyltransferase
VSTRKPTYQELKTARLVLRRPEGADAERIFRAYASDPEVTRFLMWRPHGSIADAEAAIAERIRQLEEGSEYSWVIERAGQREAIGMVSVWLADGGAEIGFVLARSYWGLGYMTEAVRAVTDWAFAQPDVTRVWATCDVENLASARVLEKAGFAARGACSREVVRPNLAPTPRPSLLFERIASATTTR